MKAIGDYDHQFPENPEEAREWGPYRRVKALDMRVLCCAKTRIEGAWAAYIGAVPGRSHDQEQESVWNEGAKLAEEIALAIFPEFAGIPYAR